MTITPVEILYQYADDEAYPGDWTSDRTVEVQTARDGVGQVVGSATARKIYGRICRPGGTVGDEPMPTVEPSLGRWTRLLRKDAGGSVSYDSESWEPFWHGYCASTRRSIGGGNGTTFPGTGETIYECRGMADAMRQILCIGSMTLIGAAQVPIDRALTFNDRYGRGQPTDAAVTLNGVSTFIFDSSATAPDDTNQWTLDTALQYLVALFTDKLMGASATTCWGYISAAVKTSYSGTVIPEFSCHGKTLFQAVSELVNLVGGVTWYVDVIAGVPTLVLYPSTADAAQTSANLKVDLDLRTDDTIESAIIHEDTTEACDELFAIGNRPIATGTVNFSTVAACVMEPDGWVTSSAPNELDPQDFTWRRYRLIDDDSSTTANFFRGLNVDTATGFDGSRNKTRIVHLRDLAMTDKMGWPNRATITGQMSMEDRRNAVVFFKATTAGIWEDVTDKAQLRIDQNINRITISPTLALRMWVGASAGAQIQITTGCLEPSPLRVSFRQTAETRGQRQKLAEASAGAKPFDQCWHDTAVPYAVNLSTGAQTATSVAAFTHDSVVDMQAAIDAQKDELVRAASVSVGWRKRVLEWDVYPGYRVATVIIGAGTITSDCLISARTWTFAESSLGTTYETVRVAPGQAIA